LLEYKPQYISFGESGLSQDFDKTILLNKTKTSLNFFYSKPNKDYHNKNQYKSSLFNPNFQDCAQYGIQGTFMNMFLPDTTFNNWYQYFQNINNGNPVLKDEILRYLKKEPIEIIPQNPLLGFKNPQTFCVSPQIKIQSSNISKTATNTSCDM
jgi:hypothetical protein